MNDLYWGDLGWHGNPHPQTGNLASVLHIQVERKG